MTLRATANSLRASYLPLPMRSARKTFVSQFVACFQAVHLSGAVRNTKRRPSPRSAREKRDKTWSSASETSTNSKLVGGTLVNLALAVAVGLPVSSSMPPVLQRVAEQVRVPHAAAHQGTAADQTVCTPNNCHENVHENVHVPPRSQSHGGPSKLDPSLFCRMGPRPQRPPIGTVPSNRCCIAQKAPEMSQNRALTIHRPIESRRAVGASSLNALPTMQKQK